MIVLRFHSFFFWFINAFLVYLPFQKYLILKFKLPHFLMWVDEIFILLIMFVGPLFLRKAKDLYKATRIVFIFLALFFVYGIMVGIINRNPLLVTVLGMGDYIKNFFPIFFLPLIWNPSLKELSRTYSVLRWIAVLLALIGIIQELCHFIGLNIPFVLTMVGDVYRYSVFRAPSVMHHANNFGLYMMIFLFLELCILKKVSLFSVLFSSGVVYSCSRTLWAMAFVSILFVAFKYRKKMIFLLSLMFFLLILFHSKSYFGDPLKIIKSDDYYRGYAYRFSYKVWTDHRLIGVGAGTFGSVISMKYYNSPIYEKYGFNPKYLSSFDSLDQFWGQCLAELGIVGTLIFLAFYLALILLCWRLARKTENGFMEGLFYGVGWGFASFLLFLFSGGLNQTSYLLTLTIFLGLALGCLNHWSNEREDVG